MLLEDVVDVDVVDGLEYVLHEFLEFGDELLSADAGVGVALELSIHLDPGGAKREDVQLVDSQDGGGRGRCDDSGRVNSPVVGLLVDDVVVSHGVVDLGVVVEFGIVELGVASSCLSSCCDGHSLAEWFAEVWLSEPVMVPCENKWTVGSL